MIHDREFFFKYVTSDTAVKILQNRTFKYSSPFTFNDPFDTQTRLDFGFDIADFFEALNEEVYRLAHDSKEPIGNETNSLFRDIKTAWQKIQQSPPKMQMSKNVWQQLIGPSVEETVRIANQHIEDRNAWWQKNSKASKIFCVAESHKNLLMWAHYAQEHTGAVIKLRCLPKIDTPLCAARNVIYSEKPPVIAELNEYVRYITGQGDAPADVYFKMFLTKSDHWLYEKEWRVFIPPPSVPTDKNGKEVLFDFIPLYPEEIHSVYFGCKMTDQNKKRIAKYLVNDFEHVKKYRCIRNEKEYKLDFEEIM
jgi:hypothetical protein